MPWNLVVERLTLPLSVVETFIEQFEHRRLEGRLSLRQIRDDVAVAAADLPRDLRRRIYNFKHHSSAHALAVTIEGWSEGSLPPTPTNHQRDDGDESISPFDLIHLALASLLGDAFAWTSIQDGRVFNDIIPIREHSDLAMSSGFTADFGLHTEDAFHACAGDYLGLMCLRNPGQTATPLAGVDVSDFNPEVRRILFQPRFIVGANIAQKVSSVTTPSPVLFGNPQDPYFHVNLNATSGIDVEAEAALAQFADVLKDNVTRVRFQPGECWYIDNLRLAHGRDAYTPTFEGRDRWLRRLYISSMFRRAASLIVDDSRRLLDPELPLYTL